MPAGTPWSKWLLFVTLPVVVIVTIIFIALKEGAWHWLGQTTNATAIEGFVAIVQGVFTLTLIVLTAFTVHANLRMARETELMAQATKRMAGIQVEQQRGAIRPVLVLRLRKHETYSGGTSVPRVNRFDLEIANVGVGPAVDANISYDGRFTFTLSSDEVFPITVAQGEYVSVQFELEQGTPFLNQADPMRWPRTQSDVDLIREKADQERAGKDKSKDPTTQQEYSRVRNEVWKRHIRYEKELTARIADMQGAGRVIATYRDLMGAQYNSKVSIQIADRGDVNEFEDDEDDMNRGYFRATWSPITLVTLSVKEEPQEEDYYGPD